MTLQVLHFAFAINANYLLILHMDQGLYKATSPLIYGKIQMALHGSVAEWSKALVLGTSLFGGVGSNPTTAKNHFGLKKTPSMWRIEAIHDVISRY